MAAERRPRRGAGLGWYVALAGLAIVVLFPVYMTVVRALSPPPAYALAGQPPYPVDIDWGVFGRAFRDGALGPKIVLSASATSIIVAAQVTTSVLAAYAFAFLDFPGRKVVFLAFLATLMLPIEVTLIANYQTIQSWRWLNSVPGLVAPFLAQGLGTFLLRQGFLGIPRDLRDAAAIDGFGHLGFLRRVALPVVRPVLAAFTVISFLSAWNQYTWPRAIIDEGRAETLQIGLKALTANPETNNLGLAAALLAALPLVVVLVVFQRHLVRGLTAGAVKG